MFLKINAEVEKLVTVLHSCHCMNQSTKVLYT